MKTRIGILGGTFNPVHLGHLIMAQDALEALDLSRVLFIPCSQPPHKTASALAPAAHRVAMLEAALAGSERMEICDLEVRRGGTNYSVDTVRELARQYPEQELVFIIGSDSLLELHQWKDIYSLLKLCRLVTMARPGFDLRLVREKDLKLDPPWPAELLKNTAGGHQIGISSSDIRHRVAEGMSIRFFVPLAVELYITEHRLYNMA